MSQQTHKLYLNETEASLRYGYSRQWFQRERWKGTGPKFIKINSGKILYPLQETDNWFASFGLKQSTSELSAKNGGESCEI
jgi:predicted DNA-binding transcriptional regulator AlpA